MRKLIISTLLGLVLSTAVAYATPVVVYDNGMTLHSQGGYCSPCFGNRLFTDFTLSNDTLIEGGAFEELGHSGYGGDITQSIRFSILDETRTTELFTDTLNKVDGDFTNNTMIGSSFDLVEFTLNNSVSLSAGHYWLSFYGNGNRLAPGLNFSNGGHSVQTSSYALHSSVTSTMNGGIVFQLVGELNPPSPISTPEPSATLLLGLGLLGLVGFHRWHQKQPQTV